MKELTITMTVPDQNDIDRAARWRGPIEPKAAVVVHVIVDDEVMLDYLRGCDKYNKNRTACDIVVSYCKQHGIKWSSVDCSMIKVADYRSHMTITSCVEIAE